MRLQGANTVFEENTAVVGRAQKAIDEYRAAQEATIQSSRNYYGALEEITTRKAALTTATNELAKAQAVATTIQNSANNNTTQSIAQYLAATAAIQKYQKEVDTLGHTTAVSSTAGPSAGSVQEAEHAAHGLGTFDPQAGEWADNYTNKLQNAILTENELKTLHEKLGPAGEKAFAEMGTAAEGFGAIITPLLTAVGLVTAAIALLGITAAIKAAEFKESLTNVMTASELLASNGVANIELYNEQLLKLGDQGPFGAIKLAAALEDVASAGYHGAEAMGVLGAAQEGALAIGTKDIASYANSLMNLMDNFDTGLNQITVDTAAPIEEQIDAYKEQITAKYTDMLTAVTVGSRSNISDITRMVGYAAPSASEAGLSSEELLATIGGLTGSGLTTKRAGPEIQQILNSIINPNAKAAEVYQGLGINPGENAVSNAGGLQEFLAKISEGITGVKGNTTFTGADPAVMAEVFGQKAVEVIRRLEQVSPEQQKGGGYDTFLNDMLSKINNSEGITSKAAAQNESTAAANWDKSLSRAEDALLVFGERFQEAGVFLISKLMPVLSTVIYGLNDMAAGLSKVIDVTGSTLGALGTLGEKLDSVGGVIEPFKAGVEAVLASLLILTAAMKGAAFAGMGVSALLGEETAAALGMVAVMNPLTITIIGVAAAFALIGLNSGVLSDAFATAGSRMEALEVKLGLIADPNANKIASSDQWVRDLIEKSTSAQTITMPTDQAARFVQDPGSLDKSQANTSLMADQSQMNWLLQNLSKMVSGTIDWDQKKYNAELAALTKFVDRLNTEVIDKIFKDTKTTVFKPADPHNILAMPGENIYAPRNDFMNDKGPVAMPPSWVMQPPPEIGVIKNGKEFDQKAAAEAFASIQGGNSKLLTEIQAKFAPIIERLVQSKASSQDVALLNALQKSALGSLVLNKDSYDTDRNGNKMNIPELELRNKIAQQPGGATQDQLDAMNKARNFAFQANPLTEQRISNDKTTLSDMMNTMVDPELVKAQMQKVFQDTVVRSTKLDGGAAMDAYKNQPEHKAAEDQLLLGQEDYANKYEQQQAQTKITNLQAQGVSQVQIHAVMMGMYTKEMKNLSVRDSYGELVNEAALHSMQAQKNQYDRQYNFQLASQKLDLSTQNQGQTENKSYATQRNDIANVLKNTIAANNTNDTLFKQGTEAVDAANNKAIIAARQGTEKVNQAAAQTALAAAQSQYQTAQSMGVGTDELRKRWAAVMQAQEDFIKSEKLGPEAKAQAESALKQSGQVEERKFTNQDLSTQIALQQSIVDLANIYRGNYPAQIEALNRLHESNMQLIHLQDKDPKRLAADTAKENAALLSGLLGIQTTKDQALSQGLNLKMSAAQYNGAGPGQIAGIANEQYNQAISNAFKEGLKGPELANAIATATQARDTTLNATQLAQLQAQSDFYTAQETLQKENGASLQAQLSGILQEFKLQQAILDKTKGLTPEQRAAKQEGLSAAEAGAVNPIYTAIASENNDAAKNQLDAAKANGDSLAQQSVLFEKYIATQKALLEATPMDPKTRANQEKALDTQRITGETQTTVARLAEISATLKAQLDLSKQTGASVQQQQQESASYYESAKQAIMQNKGLDQTTKQTDLMNLLTQYIQTQQALTQQAASENAAIASTQLSAAKQFGASVDAQRALTDASFNAQRAQITSNTSLDSVTKNTDLANLFIQRMAADQALVNQASANNVAASQINIEAAKLNGASVQQQRILNEQSIVAQRQALIDDRSLSTVDRQNKLATLQNTGITNDQGLINQATSDNTAALEQVFTSVKALGGSYAQQIAALQALTQAQIAANTDNRGLTSQQRTTADQKILLDQQVGIAQINTTAANDQLAAAQAMIGAVKTQTVSFNDQRTFAEEIYQKTVASIQTQIGLSPASRAAAIQNAQNTLKSTDLDVVKAQLAIQVTLQQQNLDVLKTNSQTVGEQADATMQLLNVQRQQILNDTSQNADQRNTSLRGADVSTYGSLIGLLQAGYTQQIGLAEENMQILRSIGASGIQQVSVITQLAELQMKDAARRNDPTAYNQALISQVQNLQGIISEQASRQTTALGSLADFGKSTGMSPEAQEQLHMQAIAVQYEASTQQLDAAQSLLASGKLMSTNADIDRISAQASQVAAQMQTSAARDQVTAAQLQHQAAQLLAEQTKSLSVPKATLTNVEPLTSKTGAGVTESVGSLMSHLVVTLPPEQVVSFTSDTMLFHNSVTTFADVMGKMLNEKANGSSAKPEITQKLQEVTATTGQFGTTIQNVITHTLAMIDAFTALTTAVKAHETAVATTPIVPPTTIIPPSTTTPVEAHVAPVTPFVPSSTNNMPTGAPAPTDAQLAYQRQLNQHMVTPQISVPAIVNPSGPLSGTYNGTNPTSNTAPGFSNNTVTNNGSNFSPVGLTGAPQQVATDSWDLLMQKLSSGLVDTTAVVAQAQQIKDQYTQQLASGKLLSASDANKLSTAVEILQQNVQTRTDTAQNESGQANLAMTLATQLAPSQYALDQQTVATNSLITSLQKLSAISGDLNGSIAQQIAQAKFAQTQKQAQFDEKQFGDLTTFAQETHASIGTMANLITQQAKYELANQAALGLTPLEIYNKQYQAKQSLLNQQFSQGAPLNFGTNLTSSPTSTAGIGQTVATFGLTNGSATTAEIATNTKRTGDLMVQSVTALANILATLQQERVSVQRSADQQLLTALPNKVHLDTGSVYNLPSQ